MLDRPTLLDGGMGTALLSRGLPPGALPEEWILSHPEEIAAVHAEHAAAGARVLLTCTFNAAAPRLEARVDPARIEALCGWAERLARTASQGGLVAGAVGPTGLPPPASARERVALEARYARPLAALATAGVDLLWIESQPAVGESLAALAAARRIGIPAVVTYTLVESDGRFRAVDGRTAEDCLAAAAGSGAAAAGVNCVFAGAALTALAGWASAHLEVPFVAKPSPGLPGAVLAPAPFADALRPAISAGARLTGGCCGASGDHLRAIGALVSSPR